MKQIHHLIFQSGDFLANLCISFMLMRKNASNWLHQADCSRENKQPNSFSSDHGCTATTSLRYTMSSVWLLQKKKRRRRERRNGLNKRRMSCSRAIYSAGVTGIDHEKDCQRAVSLLLLPLSLAGMPVTRGWIIFHSDNELQATYVLYGSPFFPESLY